MFSSSTMLRWCASWMALLLAVHLLAWAWELARVHLGLGRPGRSPFASGPQPGPVRKASTDVALGYDTPVSGSRYEMLKLLAMSLSGFTTMRLGFAFAAFAAGTLTLNLAVRAGRSERLGPIVREPLVTAALGFARLALWWIGYYCVVEEGQIARPNEAKVLVSNHVGLIEVLLLYRAARCPSFVTRIENISLPLFAGVAHVSRAIVVDRGMRASRESTMREISKRAHESCATQLMVFPEGTCNNQHCLFRFNRGAFQPAVPIQPVIFNFPYASFNPCLTGEATGGHELPGIMWRTASQIVSRVEVKYLPPYAPSAAERADATLFAGNVQALMASHLHVPVTDCTLADYTALSTRRFHSVPPERAAVLCRARAASQAAELHSGLPSPSAIESGRPGSAASKAE
ncbi:hypothetical protein T492DRAFT_979072 [Pavlovales sp. CCMP2436]|nr:hypothetical protein T492DRAFT_979072 [Pavlovales sp. CCMP2436]